MTSERIGYQQVYPTFSSFGVVNDGFILAKLEDGQSRDESVDI